MGVFSGLQITLELSSSVPAKRKLELKKLITDNDGIISFIITKKVKLRENKCLNCRNSNQSFFV